jgi:hypothetical protein
MNGEQDWDAYPPGTYVPPSQTYGPPPAYGPPSQPAYGPPPWYGASQGHGQVTPWNLPGVVTTWPYGPGRPGVATAAIVLGFVTGGLTALMSLVFLVAVASGDDDLPTTLLLLGLPCAIGLIAGSAQLVHRNPPGVLFGAAVAAVAVLVLVLIAGAATLSADSMLGLALFVLFALVLPVLTAIFARLPRVRDWANSA